VGDGQLDSDKHNAMIRLTGTFALPLTACFMLLILLIHARPYDDTEVRAFLLPPEGCPAPCFMEIRPGVTTVGAAMAALENSAWVEEVFITAYGQMDPARVEWKWSDAAPLLLERDQIPRSSGRLIARDGIVQYLEILTRVQAWEAWLILGQAEQYTYPRQTGGPIGGPRPPKPIASVYSTLITVALTDCPYTRNFWNAPVELIVAKPEVWQEQAISAPFVAADRPITYYVRELARENCPR
jgi:hypothetical protein